MANNQQPEESSPVALEIPVRTILKIIATALICLTIVHVWRFLLLLLLSIFVAVTLQPPLDWLIRRGFSRSLALLTISLGTIVLVVGSILFLVPPLVTEIGALSESLPALHNEIIKNTPVNFGLRRAIQQLLTAPIDANKMMTGILSYGQYAVAAAVDIIMLLVFSIYFLVDGPRAYEWLIPYFNPRNQKKISLTIDDVLDVVSAYISGQMLTSVLATLFTFVVLASLGVPATLSLSILAGIFDVLPVVGFFLFIIPACLMAITVSWKTALLVLTIYTAYHLVETYIIIPRVYGSRMRLSSLVILIGIVIGYSIAGVPGAIAILPILSSYPIIERIWLARQVGPAVVEEHKPIDASEAVK